MWRLTIVRKGNIEKQFCCRTGCRTTKNLYAVTGGELCEVIDEVQVSEKP